MTHVHFMRGDRELRLLHNVQVPRVKEDVGIEGHNYVVERVRHVINSTFSTETDIYVYLRG